MNIGRMERVTNLRQIWPIENDFSDWLVTDDGLALIKEHIGIDLEDPQRERPSANFYCDIVARAADEENHIVVIENQFGKTDHDHLGKLLTYAATHSALTGIWICEKAADEHRAVIDWLNSNTPPTVSLYLAEIEAWRIGASPAAPQLNIISRPNIETKKSSETTREEKEIHLWRRDLWTEIFDRAREKGASFSIPNVPNTSEYAQINIGRKTYLVLALIPSANRVRCCLKIYGGNRQNIFNYLRSQQSAIEHSIGSALEWQPRPDRTSSIIMLEKDIDPQDDANREAVKEWMAEKFIVFHRTFQGRLQTIPDAAPEIDEA